MIDGLSFIVYHIITPAKKRTFWIMKANRITNQRKRCSKIMIYKQKLRGKNKKRNPLENWYFQGECYWSQYPEPGSNRHALRHWCLRPTRLPIPPSGPLSDCKGKAKKRTDQTFGGLFEWGGSIAPLREGIRQGTVTPGVSRVLLCGKKNQRILIGAS